MPTVFLLDYDHTLYPPNVPALDEVDRRITQFVCERIGRDPVEAKRLRVNYNRTYGTTLQGLRLLHGTDPDEYYDFIHNVPAACLPPPDPLLDAWLARQTLPLYVFTNSRRDWVDKGFASMGMNGSNPIRGVFDLPGMGWEGKPFPRAYQSVEEQLRAEFGGEVQFLFADDSRRNLAAASFRGWSTVWVHWSRDKTRGPGIDREVARLTDFEP